MRNPIAARLGYETRDLSVRAVTWFAISLVAASVITYISIAGLYKRFEHLHPSPNTPSRSAVQPQVIAPPPRLQTDPSIDLETFRTAEDAKLKTYGWVDKTDGVIRLPIERAMDLIVLRGLPTRGFGTQNASEKTSLQMQQDKAAATKP